MRPNLPPSMTIGGLNREFSTIFADLLRIARSICPEWTYQGDDDFGVVLLQLASYLADHLHYRADTTLRDALPTRSPYREIVREYAEWLGYLARRPTPATAQVVFTNSAPLADEDLSIPHGFGVLADGPLGQVRFETDDDYVIESGTTSVTATVVEGTTVRDLLLGRATGRPGERFVLPYLDTVFNWGDAEIEVTVGGATAAHCRYPALLEPDALGYWVRLNRSGLLEIRFGDGTYGRSLPPGADVYATFRRGGGVAGNVAAGAISRVESTLTSESGVEVTLTATNAEGATSGEAEEGIESIRVQAPANFRTQNRAVTHDDYLSHVLAVPGVYRARLATYGVNGVRVYVVPDDVNNGGTVTRALKASIVRALDPVKMLTDCVSVETAALVLVDVGLRVTARRNVRNGSVGLAIRNLFTAPGGIFSSERVDLGQTLWQSDMIGEVEAVSGVDHLDVTRYARRPQISWPAAIGNSTLTSVTTNVTTQSQQWYVLMTSSTTFLVAGTLSGVQSEAGILGTAWHDDGGELTFTLTAGTEAHVEGDRGVIQVTPPVGNIAIRTDEFPTFDAQSVTISVTGGYGG